MVLPGLGQDGEDVEASRPFNPGDFEGDPHKHLSMGTGDADHFGDVAAYSIADSAFLDCLEVDQAGAARAPLPKALIPQVGLKFRTFDARIEAKYGVRNYIREIDRFYCATDDNIAELIPRMVFGRDPLGPAMSIVKMYSGAHVYDVQVRRTKSRGRQSIYIRSLEPRSCPTRVVQPDMELSEFETDYEDKLVVLAQRELLLGQSAVETMWTLLPVSITYHAMLRIWERGHGNGQTFHMQMADAFLRLRGVTALVEICHLASGATQPLSAIAVPFLDGFIVASGRHVVGDSQELRWGFKRDRDWRGRLEVQDEKHFCLEDYVAAKGKDWTVRRDWLGATFMGANEIGAWERIMAARQFDELIKDLSLDEIARYREWVGRSLEKPLPPNYDLSVPVPEKVIALQREMLPRVDPADERWHLLDL